MSDLALILGQGELPAILRRACPEARVLGVEGFAPADVPAFPVEELGRVLADLPREGVRRVCFAGAIRRPRIDPARLHPATLPLVPRMQAALAQGDDAALRVLVALFEEAGMAVVGAAELVPELLAGEGAMGAIRPDAAAERDAARAAALLAATGAADLGQGCVVAGGQVLAVEALPGTDWMLENVAALRRDGPPVPKGGLLMKRPKPGQDRRVDLPAIGPETVRRAAAAGLAGIAVEAGGVLILDRAATARAADGAGLFLWGVA